MFSFWPFPNDTFNPGQNCGESVAIARVAVKGQCANDDAAGFGHGPGRLGAEFVFLGGPFSC